MGIYHLSNFAFHRIYFFPSVQSLSPLGAAFPKNWPLPLPNQMQGHNGSSIYRDVCMGMSSCSWAGQGGAEQ